MTQVLERPVTIAQSVATPDTPRHFSYSEFRQMSEFGWFADQHVELLNGEITVKGMQSPRHAYAILFLDEAIKLLLGKTAVVAVQLPIALLAPPPDFLEPDIAIRLPPLSRYADKEATSADTVLVIEISDSTLERDQNAKLEAYARNQIPEYWIYNLHNNTLTIQTEPRDNIYTLSRVLHVGQAASIFEQTLEWWG